MCKQFDFFTLFFGFLYKSKGVELFLELLSSATGSSRSRHTSSPVIALLVVVRVTVFALAKVPTSLIKHKCVRKEVSTPSLKTVHRTVFLTVAFNSCHSFAGYKKTRIPNEIRTNGIF